MLELRISTANNGFILYSKVETEDNVWVEEMEVVEETNDEHDLFRRMLEKVAEYFGITYNKYGHDNINITFDKKGCKVE